MTSWLRTSSAFADSGYTHGWSTITGPDFGVPPDTADHGRRVARLVRAVGLTEAAWVRQVHGGTVLRAVKAGFLGEADALWTDRPGLGVVGRSADCPLILVGGDGPRPLGGFAHASWRSTVAGITTGLMAALGGAGLDPAHTSAVICPSAGPCCYEVGDEVREQAQERLGQSVEAFFVRRHGRWMFDLWQANRAQLEAAGVAPGRINVSGVCTICGTGYPSHRRDGEAAGRFAAVIGRR